MVAQPLPPLLGLHCADLAGGSALAEIVDQIPAGVDVERHLKGEPVGAGPPGTMYRVKKFVRRHRVGVVTAAAATLLLALTAGVIVYAAVRDARQRTNHIVALQAEQAKTLEEKKRSERQTEQAETARAEAEAVTEFIQSIFTAADANRWNGAPNERPASQMTVTEALDKAAAQLDGGSLKGQPKVEAAVRSTLGETYRVLGVPSRAQEQLRKSLNLYKGVYPQGNHALASCLRVLAIIAGEGGDVDAAEELFRQALVMDRRLYGERYRSVAHDLAGLGAVQQSRGDLAGAEALYREALAIFEADPEPKVSDSINAMNSIAVVLSENGDLAESEVWTRRCVALAKKGLGEQHPMVAVTLENLAIVLWQRRDLEGQRRCFGKYSP